MSVLKDKVAIVTGSCGGIGKSIAMSLSSMGAHIIITSRDKDRAEKMASELEKNGHRATPCRFKLEESQSGVNLLDTAIKAGGRLDILVNNAVSHPTLPPLPLQNMSYEQLEVGITTNLTNILALNAIAHPYLKKTNGCVLNVGSAVVNRNMKSIPLYIIVKGALTQMTKTLAAEWANDNIRVNQINPGVVQTESFKNIGVKKKGISCRIKHYEKYHPLGRIGTPQEIGALAAFMVSPEASWMTGSVIDLDGGFSIQAIPAPPEI